MLKLLIDEQHTCLPKITITTKMYPHKLKVHIVATLFCLLFFGMLGINIVIFIFWYQHLKQEEVVQLKAAVSVWNSQHINDNFIENLEARESLRLLQKQLGPECRQVMLQTDKQTFTAIDASEDLRLEQLIRSTQPSIKGTVRQLNKRDNPFIFLPKILAFIFPIESQLQVSKLAIVVDAMPILMRLLEKEKIIIVYIFLNAFILTVIGFFRMRYVLLNPIEKLASVAESYQISEGQGLFGEHSENEFGQLSLAMNAMVRRIEEDRSRLFNTVTSLEETNKRLQDAQQEIIRSEKMAAAGRLSAGLAHEIGNPVAIIQGYLELLQSNNITPDDHSQFTGRSIVELQRIDKLLRQLMEITRPRETGNEVVFPGELLHNLLEVLETSFKKNDIAVSFTSPVESIAIYGDDELLRQVLLNLLLNAQDGIVDKVHKTIGGKIEIKMDIVDSQNESRVLLEIADNGMGIQAHNLKFIFEPFFTTKAPGKGTGLGLAVSYRIIESLGGRIEVTSEWGEGSVFRIFLPQYTENINS